MGLFNKDNKKQDSKEHDEIERRFKEEREMLDNMRKIVIRTDGNNIVLEVAEVSGNIELVGALQSVINGVKSGVIRVSPVTLLNIEKPNEPQTVTNEDKPEKPAETNNK